MFKYKEWHTNVQQKWLTGTQSSAVYRVTQENVENNKQVCVEWQTNIRRNLEEMKPCTSKGPRYCVSQQNAKTIYVDV